MRILKWIEKLMDSYLGESQYQKRQGVRRILIENAIEDWKRKGYGEIVEFNPKIVSC